MEQATFDRLKTLKELTGLSMGDTIKFLLDNRPEIKYAKRPKLLAPKQEQTKEDRIEELQAFIAAVQSMDENDPEAWAEAQAAQAEWDELEARPDDDSESDIF